MKLQLNKLTLKNFLSFEEAELELTRNGYVMVNGINENPDDLARSNGSGKSSIWEAIAWCITGETIRGTKEVKRIGAESGCEVTLTFKADKDEYKLVRSKDPTNLKIYINGEDKSGKGIRDSEKLLAEYLPDLTPQLLGSVVILGQGLPQRFTNNTPSGRKEVLEKLSKSDFMIDDLKKRIAARKDYLQHYIRTCEDNILSDTTKVDMTNAQLESTKQALANLPTADVYEEQVASIKALISEQEIKIAEAEENKNALTQKLDSIKDRINAAYKAMQDRNNEINNNYYVIAQTVNNEISTAQANISNLSAEITKLKSVKEFCPTCGQRLPDVHIVDTTEQEKSLDDLKKSLDIYKKNKSNLDSARASELKESESQYNNDTAELKAEQIEVNNGLSKATTEYKSLVDNKIAQTTALEKAKLGLETLEDARASYIKSIDDFNSLLVDLSKRIDYNKIDRDTMDERLAIVNKMSTAVTRDFRGYLLSNVITFINNKAKEYSKQVFDTDKLDFTVDGNNISISYDAKEYENLSGGEKQKVDLIVQLAIRDMLCTFLGFSCNILVVDELFDNLDDIGCQRVIDLISNKITDVDTVYIVTHHRDISIPTDSELVVIKGRDKISRIGG